MARRIGTAVIAVLVLSVSAAASRRAILSEAGGSQVGPAALCVCSYLPAAHLIYTLLVSGGYQNESRRLLLYKGGYSKEWLRFCGAAGSKGRA